LYLSEAVVPERLKDLFQIRKPLDKKGRPIMKRTISIIAYLVAFSVFFITGQAFGARVLDDFSGTYIDGQRWNDRELVREIVGGKLVSKVGNGPGKNYTEFQNPSTINIIQSDITVVTAILDTGTNPSSSARIQGLFYNTQTSGGATGDIWAGISIGDRGSGLEAWWSVEEALNDERTSWSNKGSGTLKGPGTLTYGTAYTAKLAYDGANGFTFTVAGASDTFTGPVRQRAADTEHKALATRISTDVPSYDGFVSALFDNVYINNQTVVYDAFSTAPLDATKWQNWSLEIAREISGGKLRLNVQADGSRRDVSIRQSDQAAVYLETKVLVESASQISSGASGIARIAGWYYNDSRGPGSGQPYNGNEGDVWVQNRIELDDSNNLLATCGLWRSDADPWGPGAGIFGQNFSTPIAFDTEYILSIEQRGKTFIFKCNNETYQYTVTTPMYDPSGGQFRYLQSRVYADPGESGYMKTTFDDVCLNKPFNVGPPSLLLLND
jgi:hypothetical protein